jgi:hypothetical protein
MSKKLLALGLAVGLVAAVAQAGVYPDPPGGWAYTYGGHAVDPSPHSALDLTWDHDNGSDQWDGSMLLGIGRPGGAMVINPNVDLAYLRMQETGDPRDYGMGDPGSNRKMMFTREIPEPTILNGVTLSFRARIPTVGPLPLDDLHPDGGGGVIPYPAGGDGYITHDGGKGSFGVRQADGDMIVSFTLGLPTDDDDGDVFIPGLIMNKLNGNTPNNDVDLQGETGGNINILPLVPTDWHEFYIVIRPDASATGTHEVMVWVDNGGVPRDPDGVFLVTAGTGNDEDYSYLEMGLGATPQSGALDVDFFSYAPGWHPVPEPATIVLLGLGGLALLRRKR